MSANAEATTSFKLAEVVVKPAKKVHDFVNKLGRGRSPKNSSSSNGKKSVRFAEIASIHLRPNYHRFDGENALWYTQKECKAMLFEDVDKLMRMGGDQNDSTARGLELYMISNKEYALRKHATNHYRRSVMAQSHRSNKFYSKALLKISKRLKTELSEAAAYSLKATSVHQDAAYQLAREDEMQARMIYLELDKIPLRTPAVARTA